MSEEQENVDNYHTLAGFLNYTRAPASMKPMVQHYMLCFFQLDALVLEASKLANSQPSAPDDADEQVIIDVESHQRLATRVRHMASEAKDLLRQAHWSLSFQGTRLEMRLPQDLEDVGPKWAHSSIITRLKGLGGSFKSQLPKAEIQVLKNELQAIKNGTAHPEWQSAKGDPKWGWWCNQVNNMKKEVASQIEASMMQCEVVNTEYAQCCLQP